MIETVCDGCPHDKTVKVGFKSVRGCRHPKMDGLTYVMLAIKGGVCKRRQDGTA